MGEVQLSPATVGGAEASHPLRGQRCHVDRRTTLVATIAPNAWSSCPRYSRTFTASCDGCIVLCWDNSYSRFRSKQVDFRIDIVDVDGSSAGGDGLIASDTDGVKRRTVTFEEFVDDALPRLHVTTLAQPILSARRA